VKEKTLTTKTICIPSIEIELDENGGAVARQDHHDGDSEHWVELHAVHIHALLEHAKSDSLINRLCLIAERMKSLQDQLIGIELQPYDQPSDMGSIILADLDMLIEDLGLGRGVSTIKKAGPQTNAPAKQGSSAERQRRYRQRKAAVNNSVT
jgi:hypothetical protein